MKKPFLMLVSLFSLSFLSCSSKQTSTSTPTSSETSTSSDSSSSSFKDAWSEEELAIIHSALDNHDFPCYEYGTLSVDVSTQIGNGISFLMIQVSNFPYEDYEDFIASTVTGLAFCETIDNQSSKTETGYTITTMYRDGCKLTTEVTLEDISGNQLTEGNGNLYVKPTLEK